jgi:acetyl-CoA carboxylase biotin carboxyl carrier protein
MMIELDFIRGLIDAVDRSGIDTLEITRAGTRIRIAKTPPPAAGAPGAAQAYMVSAGHGNSAPPAAAASAPAAPAGTEPAAAPAPAGGAAPAAAASRLVEITSPMVGTFYRAPAPEAPPYVDIGQRVSRGQTLCILEAMKLMNELECEVDGVLREVLVENAEPVEYGQVLFRVEPA